MANDLRKAAEMALEFVSWFASEDHSIRPKHKAPEIAEALRKALAEEALDRMAAENQRLGLYDDAVNMTPERVDETAKGEHDSLGSEWVECVKLPIVVHVRKQRDGETHISTREGITPVLSDDLIMRGVAGEEYPIGRELFERTYTFDTAPPKREWVGLTDADIDQTMHGSVEGSNMLPYQFARAIEAKLKEKNGG